MRNRVLASIALVFGVVSCQSFGDGTGEIRGEVRVARCTIDGVGVYRDRTFPAYDLGPSFYVAERRQNVMQIRIQRDTRLINQTDVMVLDVRDVTRVQVGLPVEVRPDTEPDVGAAAPARLALSLKDSCPRFESSLLGRGTLTFNEFDPRKDGVADATFTVDLIDGQSAREGGTEVVVGQLRGRFRMALRFEAEPG